MGQLMQKIVLALILSGLSWAAQAKTWLVDAAQSKLAFSGTYQEDPFDGRFPFTAQIAFDPANLKGSKLDVSIDVTRVNSENEERDAALAEPVWFDFVRFPRATFVTSAIRATPRGYIADALLTIRGSAKKIQFPFTWSEKDGQATLTAKITLNRLDFGLGSEEWEDPELIGHEVTVSVLVVSRAR